MLLKIFQCRAILIGIVAGGHQAAGVVAGGHQAAGASRDPLSKTTAAAEAGV